MVNEYLYRGNTALLTGYDTAQICENGHPINWQAETREGKNQDYCSKCGAATITACKHCQESIRGVLHIPNVRFPNRVTPSAIPSFCHKCGKPYPWMEERLATARELLFHDEKLSLDEREKLWSLLQYVMSNPTSDLVPAKRKLIDIDLRKAAAITRNALTDLLAKCLVEMAKSY